MNKKQAQTGGEFGVNLEYYKGGQFMPSSELTIKGAKIKASKKLVAPYVYEIAPADDMVSIYDRIEPFCSDNRRECQYVKGQGFIGLKLELTNSYNLPQAQIDFFSKLAARWNAGERWYMLAEDAFHFKNL